ncbi:dethiobiotin synthase [Colwelliaceae bacterium 6441]
MTELFITATDTDAGKTYFSQVLVTALVQHGLKVAVFKPISAGCELLSVQNGEQLVNEDAVKLFEAANSSQTLAQINPIMFEEPIAPHIAAKKQNQTIELEDIYRYYQRNKQLKSDVLITEGAGGWRLPLGHGKYLSEFVTMTNQKVILVVNMKLGCLNHAILSFESIVADGLTCIGWVANCPETMDYLSENIDELKNLLPVPLLAKLPKQTNIEQAAANVDLKRFFAAL